MTSTLKESPSPTSKTLIAAVVGRTGSGKSTLINALVGEHVSIVSNRTQTTRQLVRGIMRYKDCQLVLTDTPGFQENPHNQLNRLMNRHLSAALQEPEVVVWVADVRALWKNHATEKRMMEKLLRPFWDLLAEPANLTDSTKNPSNINEKTTRVVVVLNKIDQFHNRADLLPLLARLAKEYPNTDWVPLSALRQKNTDELLNCLYKQAKLGKPLFPDDQYTNKNESFLVTELLRESLYKHLYQELPFGCSVFVDEFEDDVNQRGQPISRISLTIAVSAPNHKPMILGKKGQQIKAIASEARVNMEKMLDRRIFLTTWVKVIEGWHDDANKLKSMGYSE